MSTSSVMQETRLRPSRRAALRDRRGLALAIVLGAQLMIILDLTVVNIALPNIARGLDFSTAGLSWVLNAYALTFGGLLLLGGRAGDILGRRRVFVAGILLFTAASLAGGLAQSAGWLLAARAAQGVGGAIASPAVLAMITASFADGRERARALGIYTAVVMGGGSLGLVLGGVITEWVSWRWVLFINVPIGVLVAIAAPMFLPETARQPGHFDVAGALASTAGMVSLVYAIIRAAADGWSDPVTLATFAAAAVLLAGFVWHESRARQPITPLRLFADRRRAGSYLTRLLLVAGMFGMFFFLTQFVQEILGFSPLRAGISFLPMTAALFGVSRLAPRLVSRFRPWTLMVTGMLPVVAGMTWLSRIAPGTGYLAGVLGPMVLIGAGMGVVFVPLTMASLSGVRPEDSGAASSMVNVMQQVGGSLGLAVLVTAAGGAMGHAAGQAAVVHGMSRAFSLAAVLDVLALLVVLTVMRAARNKDGATASDQERRGGAGLRQGA
jgi:EmrB/QacA subfamily drug resistance transporter